MVLYADRCTMSPRTMTDMKKSIVEALSDFVEIDAEDKVDLSVSADPELGTIYSVSVPVRRVKVSEIRRREQHFCVCVCLRGVSVFQGFCLSAQVRPRESPESPEPRERPGAWAGGTCMSARPPE